MPLYDFECQNHGAFELFTDVEDRTPPCPVCSEPAHRLPGFKTNANQDADWIRSVTEVVAKDGDIHDRQFLKEPTRDNYKAWMEKKGLRHLEPGEKHGPQVTEKEEQATHEHLTDLCMKRHNERKAINVQQPKNV